MAVLIQTVCASLPAADVRAMVLFAVTVMVPVALTSPHPPVNGMLYVKVPEAVGVPLIVMVLFAHAAVTPAGNPVGVPIPVAPVVVWVTLVIAVPIHNVGVDDAAVTVLIGVTVMVPVDVIVPQPPVKVTV